MGALMIKIEQVFSIKKWETVQDSLAETTGMAILMVDYKGRPITKHSCCCEFCDKVRSDEVLKKYCEKCDSRGGAEAVRQNKPYIYKCCFGMVDVAIPIVFKETYLGAVMIGQVRTDYNELEQIASAPENKIIQGKLEDLKDEYEQVRKLDFDKISTVSYMLYDICNYIVERENQNATGVHEEDFILRKENDEIVKKNRIVEMAQKYIQENLENNITLAETAEICHVSASHLSRLFIKETGEGFSVFVSNAKIEKAKEWLETEEWSVSDIGYRLGFNETGYFIRAFKKKVGMTPGMYRKYRGNVYKKSEKLIQFIIKVLFGKDKSKK